MADRKISDLTALTTPASGDYLPIVDISESAAASKNKRVTVQSLFQGIPVNVGIGTSSPRFNLSLGAVTSTGSATPTTLDLGGSFSSAAGANPKLRLYWDGTNSYGFGVSAGQLDYMVPGGSHVFYANGLERLRIDGSGRLLVGTSTDINGDLLQVNGGIYAAAPIGRLKSSGSGSSFTVTLPDINAAWELSIYANVLSAGVGDRRSLSVYHVCGHAGFIYGTTAPSLNAVTDNLRSGDLTPSITISATTAVNGVINVSITVGSGTITWNYVARRIT